MPLEKGKSNKVISKNIAELKKSYNKTGKLGTSHPKSKEKAAKQAAAIAYSEADRTKKESFMSKFEQLVENLMPSEHSPSVHIEYVPHGSYGTINVADLVAKGLKFCTVVTDNTDPSESGTSLIFSTTELTFEQASQILTQDNG